MSIAGIGGAESRCLIDYVQSKEEVPSYLIFARKSHVACHLVGKAGYRGKSEGWAAHYPQNCEVVDVRASNKNDLGPDIRSENEADALTVDDEGIEPIMNEVDHQDVIDSDLGTILCAEDAAEYEASNVIRRAKNQTLAEELVQKMNSVLS